MSSDLPLIDIYKSRYTVSGKDQLTIEYAEDSSLEFFTYQIVDNTLELSSNEDSDYHISLTRARNTTAGSHKIVGNWHLLSAEYSETTYYRRRFYDITFYSDGTYKATSDNQWGQPETDSGTYSLIHDETTLEMGRLFGSQQSITFPCDDIMILYTNYGELLYIAQ